MDAEGGKLTFLVKELLPATAQPKSAIINSGGRLWVDVPRLFSRYHYATIVYMSAWQEMRVVWMEARTWDYT